MYPTLWQFGTLVLPTWHVLFLVACVASFFLLRRLSKVYQSQYLPLISNLYICAYGGALLGGRLLSVIVENDHFEFSQIWTFSSLTLYGGFLGAVLFTSVYIFIKGLPIRVFWDLMIPPFLLGLAIGRIGCFLNGDDFGIAVEAEFQDHFPWWATSFPNHPQPVPRMPVQIIESATSLTLAVLLSFFFKNLQKLHLGLVGSIGVLAYAVERFFLEFYRDDFRGWLLAEKISTSQGISLLLAGTILSFYAFRSYKYFRVRLRLVT